MVNLTFFEDFCTVIHSWKKKRQTHPAVFLILSCKCKQLDEVSYEHEKMEKSSIWSIGTDIYDIIVDYFPVLRCDILTLSINQSTVDTRIGSPTELVVDANVRATCYLVTHCFEMGWGRRWYFCCAMLYSNPQVYPSNVSYYMTNVRFHGDNKIIFNKRPVVRGLVSITNSGTKCHWLVIKLYFFIR